MLRTLLLLTILCTCGPAQMLAQLTFSVNAGYSFGTFNQQPELISNVNRSGQRDYLDAINSPTVGLDVSYAPATKSLSWGLQIGYSKRGYQNRIELENGERRDGFLFPSFTDYLDIAPRMTYRPGRLFSASIGPYLSLGWKLEDNPFVVERDRRTNTYDYGVKIEGRLHFGRAYIFTAHQRSFREYNFVEVPDNQSGGLLFSIKQPSPISALQVGVGFTVIR